MSITGKRAQPFRYARAIHAFTLMELLVVISIIAILAGLTIGAASALRARAHVSATRAMLDNLTLSIDAFRAEYGQYPADNGGPVLTTDPNHGIKNLRIQLAGNHRCSGCGYIYDKYHEAGPEGHPIAFQELPAGWQCPSCSAGKASFARMPDFLDWLSEKHIGRGIVDFRIGQRQFNPAGLGDVTWNIQGAIVDSWGLPFVYDSLFNEADQAAARARYPEDIWSNQMFRMSAGNWVIYSHGPD